MSGPPASPASKPRPEEEPESERPHLEIRDLQRIGIRACASALVLTLVGFLVFWLLLPEKPFVFGWREGARLLLLLALQFVLLSPLSWLEFDAKRRLEGAPTFLGWVGAFCLTWVLAGFVIVESRYADYVMAGSGHLQAWNQVVDFVAHAPGLPVLLGFSTYMTVALLSVTAGRLKVWSFGSRFASALLSLPHYVFFRVALLAADAACERLLPKEPARAPGSASGTPQGPSPRPRQP